MADYVAPTATTTTTTTPTTTTPSATTTAPTTTTAPAPSGPKVSSDCLGGRLRVVVQGSTQLSAGEKRQIWVCGGANSPFSLKGVPFVQLADRIYEVTITKTATLAVKDTPPVSTKCYKIGRRTICRQRQTRKPLTAKTRFTVPRKSIFRRR